MLRNLLRLTGLAVALLSSAAMADEPIGGSYYQNSSATNPFTIISSAANVNGLHVRTLVIACSGNASIWTTPPTTGAVSRAIMACNPQSPGQGITMLPTPLYLPPGYSLSFSVGSTTPNQVYMTYDLSGS